MKTIKVTKVEATIDGASKEEKTLQVMKASLDLVRSLDREDLIGLAVALVTAAIFQKAGVMPEVDAVELCEQCGVHVGVKAEF